MHESMLTRWAGRGQGRLLWGLALALLLLPGPARAATPALRPAPAADTGCWTVFSDLGAADANSFVHGLAAIAPDDVWAVGLAIDAGGTNHPLALHWDGRAWQPVPLPEGATRGSLAAVAGRTANDVWAVGTAYQYPGADPTTPLVLHWDGHAWTLAPLDGAAQWRPTSVAVPAQGSPWLGGYLAGGSAFLARWDGQTWRDTPLPVSPKPGSEILGMTAGQGGELWAVGGPDILHYDGTQWEFSTSSDLLAAGLVAAAAPGAGDAWAAGSYNPLDHQPQNQFVRATLIEHWNGQGWSQVASPNPTGAYYIAGIAAPRPDEAWAVGYQETGDRHFPTDHPLVERWDGSAWKEVASPAPAGPAPNNAQWLAATTLSNGDVWIAGTAQATQSGTRRARIAWHTPGACSQTFPETGQTVSGLFLDYWQQHGGLAQQGYPISGEFQEVSALNGQPYTVQYFERAVFEKHPENAPPYNVLLSQLGTFQYHKKYPNGAPNQVPNKADNGRYFAETGHWVGGKFRDYWESHGGLAQQGYPLSDEFTEVSDLNGKPYTVQYFERAIFEYHPENLGTPYVVLLSQLGTFRARELYPQGFPPK